MMLGMGTNPPGTVDFPPAGLADQCGATPVKDSTGIWTCPNAFAAMTPATISHCNSWAYYLDPICWTYSRAAWEQAGQFQTFGSGLPTPTPPPPVDLANTQSGSYSGDAASQEAQYAAAVNASLTAGSAANQAAMLQYYQTNGPNVAPDCGFFSGAPQLQGDGVTWTCPSLFGGLGGISTTTILIAVAAIGGLVLLTSRRGR